MGSKQVLMRNAVVVVFTDIERISRLSSMLGFVLVRMFHHNHGKQRQERDEVPEAVESIFRSLSAAECNPTRNSAPAPDLRYRKVSV